MLSFRALALAALLVAAAPASPGWAQGCVPDSQAHQLIQQGQAIGLADALNRAGIPRSDIASVRLCHGGGGYIYSLQLRDGSTRDIPAS